MKLSYTNYALVGPISVAGYHPWKIPSWKVQRVVRNAQYALWNLKRCIHVMDVVDSKKCQGCQPKFPCMQEMSHRRQEMNKVGKELPANVLTPHGRLPEERTMLNHSCYKAVWKPKGFTRENGFQQISWYRSLKSKNFKKQGGCIF